jgi:saccharopine dehydrogenase-like NADP-dependent oxidoreductase
MTRKLLLVGAGGAFGLRLAHRLAASVTCELLVAGRSQARCSKVVAELRRQHPGVLVSAVTLDRETASPGQLRALAPFIVIDAAGPFQGHEPHLARAAIAAGCHFIDLADARDYVARFPELDAAAREAGVLAAAGASSTPALSNAALDVLTSGWAEMDSVTVAIAPGNRAPRGLAVTQAILSYAGKPVRLLENKAWRTRPGWSLLQRKMLPGLGPRWLSLCETPDLDVIPARFCSVRTVQFLAGLELSLLHVGLWACGLLVRMKLVASLAPAARFFVATAKLFEPFGSDRGAMLVEATGTDQDGKPARANWSLVAEAGDGPNIPVLPALALIRKLLDGTETRHGAYICAGLLRLDEITAEFAAFRITVTQTKAG